MATSASAAATAVAEASPPPSTDPGLLKVEAGAERRNADQVFVAGLKRARKERVCTAKERISRMPPCAAGKRSSIYRGVTRHRWTGRYEAHLWDKSTWNQNQNKKGKQVYLGAYDDEEAAARAYDLAALKYWGAGTLINFPVSDYARDLEEMQMVSKEDYLASLRRKSSAFARGFPKYRALSRQHNSKWDASFGQSPGSSYLNCSTSKEVAMDGSYIGSFGLDRKIDLTSYIRWWVPKKAHQSEDVSNELLSLESSVPPTEPYKLPSLGLHQKVKPRSGGLSALSILSRSDAFKNFKENSSKLPGCKLEDVSKETDHGNTVAPMFCGNGLDSSLLNIGLGELPMQRAPYSLAPLLSAPLKTSWSPADPVTDPLFWTGFVPSSEQSLTTSQQKNEINSSYSFQCQD